MKTTGHPIGTLSVVTLACEMGHHKGCYKGRHVGCTTPTRHWCECDCHPYDPPTVAAFARLAAAVRDLRRTVIRQARADWERFRGWLRA